MTYEDIPGWFDYAGLYDREVGLAPPGATLVEVGCWLGRSLAYLGAIVRDRRPDLRVVGVDPGFGSVGMCDEAIHAPVLAELGGNTTARLLCNLRDCGVLDHVTVIAAPSVRAARLFAPESLHMVFLDGAHDTPSVTADVLAWIGKVAPGGLFGGHDYDGCWPSVERAVDESLTADGPRHHDPDFPHCWSRRIQ